MVLAVLGSGLLVLGAAAVALGVLPAQDALALGERVAPVLGFVVAITVVAAVASEAGVFDRLADLAARVARGRGALLWLLVAAVAVASTVFLSLDTTAVLLTPVVVVLARRVGLSPLPFAMTTVWLANTGSLLLPVSNLTNLLAESDPAFGAAYVSRSWAPALVAVVVPLAILAVVHRHALRHRYEPPAARTIGDPVLFRTAAIVLALLVPALAVGEPLLHVPVWVPAAAAAVVLVVAARLRAPAVLRWRLLPVPLVLFVCGLFLAVDAIGRLGLTDLLAAAAGTGEGPGALLRLAGVGTVTANLADNLPAYLALEPVAGSEQRLLALLVAVNAGPLVTPWASLATLLWHGRLEALDVHVSWWRFAALGLVAAPVTVALATLAILLT
ncbi:SLC13 family permease [Amnibacterium endophyticum]|uniref:SLC13 family permease n=1 Tax=Amnibacterium endophyticum TaxID=2109337 RepID=A0ABW4LF52_9MICO